MFLLTFLSHIQDTNMMRNLKCPSDLVANLKTSVAQAAVEEGKEQVKKKALRKGIFPQTPAFLLVYYCVLHRNHFLRPTNKQQPKYKRLLYYWSLLITSNYGIGRCHSRNDSLHNSCGKKKNKTTISHTYVKEKTESCNRKWQKP